MTNCRCRNNAECNATLCGTLLGPAVAVGAPGRKDDGGKDRWDLLFFGLRACLSGAAKVLTFGAKKYADNSWQNVDNGKARYTAAMFRHLDEALDDPDSKDSESGLLHAWHFLTNALFISYFIYKESKDAK